MLIEHLNIKSSPDFSRLKKVLNRNGEPDRVPFYELFFDKPMKDSLLGRECLFPILFPVGDMEKMMENEVELWYRLGFDYVGSAPAFMLGGSFTPGKDTADLSGGARFWLNEQKGSGIKNRADFEKYAWLDPQTIDLGPMEQLAEKLLDGMALIPLLSGITENATWTMGYESIAVNMIEDPDLIGMVFEKVGDAIYRMAKRLVKLPKIGALAMGDDMGHKTSTLLNPKMLRQLAFPWHKKIVSLCHQHGLPFILHSCGKVDVLMEDFIKIGVDAKHSFEDAVTPVTEAKKKWGDRIALLGGIDMDILARGSVEAVRARVRQVLEGCMQGGGYALGTGNSVANYLKPANYLAMLEEGWKVGRY